MEPSGSLDMLNPYEPPQDPDQDPDLSDAESVEIYESLALVELEISRESFIDRESCRKWALSVAAIAMLSEDYLVGLVTPLIEHPAVIFGDLKRPRREQDFCYCGCAGEYISKGQIVTPQTNTTVLAYATFDKESDFVVITRIDHRDEGNPKCHPLNHENDFGKQLWKR